MNGNTARLESADPGSEVDAWARCKQLQAQIDTLIEASQILERLQEQKAFREVVDAAIRLQSTYIQEARATRERVDRSEALHGQAPPNAQVTRG